MRLVFDNLTRRPLRSFLAVLGVAVGIAAVVGLISLARGFRKGLDDLLLRLRGDIIVKQVDSVAPQSSRIAETLLQDIADVEGVAAVSGYTVQLVFFGEFRVPVYGYLPGQPILDKLRVVEGRRLAAAGLNEVMLGEEAARNLDLHAGDTFTVPPSDPAGTVLHVVGVYSTGSRYQDFGCVVHLRAAQLIERMPGQVMMCAIDVEDPDAAAVVRDRLRERYSGLEVQLARDYTESLSDLHLVTKFAWAISAIAAVVGAIGVLNTMLMSVVERTREIGMLLALGWSRAMVLRMVLLEGLAVSALGGAAGIGLGLLLVRLVASAIEEVPLVAGHDLALFGQAMALAAGLGALGSLLPACRAARLSPVEALRYE